MDTYAYLHLHGIRPSVQRHAVMAFLLQNRTHPTADEIYQALVATMPTLSKTTVYNTLHLLVAKGAVNSVTIDEHNVYYDATIEPHGHFLCLRCGKVTDVPLDEDVIEMAPRLPAGYEVQSVGMYYKGICRDCCIQRKNR